MFPEKQAAELLARLAKKSINSDQFFHSLEKQWRFPPSLNFFLGGVEREGKFKGFESEIAKELIKSSLNVDDLMNLYKFTKYNGEHKIYGEMATFIRKVFDSELLKEYIDDSLDLITDKKERIPKKIRYAVSKPDLQKVLDNIRDALESKDTDKAILKLIDLQVLFLEKIAPILTKENEKLDIGSVVKYLNMAYPDLELENHNQSFGNYLEQAFQEKKQYHLQDGHNPFALGRLQYTKKDITQMQLTEILDTSLRMYQNLFIISFREGVKNTDFNWDEVDEFSEKFVVDTEISTKMVDLIYNNYFDKLDMVVPLLYADIGQDKFYDKLIEIMLEKFGYSNIDRKINLLPKTSQEKIKQTFKYRAFDPLAKQEQLPENETDSKIESIPEGANPYIKTALEQILESKFEELNKRYQDYPNGGFRVAVMKPLLKEAYVKKINNFPKETWMKLYTQKKPNVLQKDSLNVNKDALYQELIKLNKGQGFPSIELLEREYDAKHQGQFQFSIKDRFIERINVVIGNLEKYKKTSKRFVHKEIQNIRSLLKELEKEKPDMTNISKQFNEITTRLNKGEESHYSNMWFRTDARRANSTFRPILKDVNNLNKEFIEEAKRYNIDVTAPTYIK